MGGEFTYPKKWDPIGFDDHGHLSKLILSIPQTWRGLKPDLGAQGKPCWGSPSCDDHSHITSFQGECHHGARRSWPLLFSAGLRPPAGTLGGSERSSALRADGHVWTNLMRKLRRFFWIRLSFTNPFAIEGWAKKQLEAQEGVLESPKRLFAARFFSAARLFAAPRRRRRAFGSASSATPWRTAPRARATARGTRGPEA